MNTKKEKKQNSKRILLWCALLFFVALAIDLITKGWAEYYFVAQGNDDINFIPGFMRLTMTYNSGMAFSWFSDNPLVMDVITWLTVPLMLVFVVIICRLPSHYNVCRLLLSVVTAGAAGNFFDRVLIEAGVRDFMDVSSIGFGVCNFADYFLSIGGVILVICMLICIATDKEEEKKEKKDKK